VLVLAGCDRSVPVAVPSPAPEVATACASLLDDVPDKVLSAKRRDTTPESRLTAAWGDPPIELACGVAPPAGMATAQSQCFEVNGVGWYAEQAENGYVFTTVGRKLYVEVSVPDDYRPEANALTDLSDTLTKHNPVITPCT
jgi:hypothetical protein